MGKGCGDRDISHKKTTHNESLKIILEDLDPIILRVESGLSQLEAHFIENKLMIDSDISEVKFYLINKLSNNRNQKP